MLLSINKIVFIGREVHKTKSFLLVSFLFTIGIDLFCLGDGSMVIFGFDEAIRDAKINGELISCIHKIVKTFSATLLNDVYMSNCHQGFRDFKGLLWSNCEGSLICFLSLLISRKGKLPQIPFFNIFFTDSTKHGEHFGI